MGDDGGAGCLMMAAAIILAAGVWIGFVVHAANDSLSVEMMMKSAVEAGVGRYVADQKTGQARFEFIKCGGNDATER